jgi:hypothetical protein
MFNCIVKNKNISQNIFTSKFCVATGVEVGSREIICPISVPDQLFGSPEPQRPQRNGSPEPQRNSGRLDPLLINGVDLVQRSNCLHYFEILCRDWCGSWIQRNHLSYFRSRTALREPGASAAAKERGPRAPAKQREPRSQTNWRNFM